MEFQFQTDLLHDFERHYAGSGRKQEALFEAIRAAILSGKIPLGTKLPSTRRLSEWYGVSRGSVNTAYDMLYSEGYVQAEVGRGTYAAYRPAVLKQPGGAPDTKASIPLTSWAERLAPVPVPHRSKATTLLPQDMIDLSFGSTDPDVFPMEAWKREVYTVIRELADRQYEDAFAPHGHRALREAITQHLARERGIRTDPEHIMITNGSMQAIALLAMLLVKEGDHIVVENPSYSGIYRAVRSAGGRIISARVDEHGIVPDNWMARLLFVTPSRQFPTGAVLPLERRTALIEWASRREAIIVEDDYDSEFRWGGRPVEPLKTLDREGRVVYLGTFSKSMLVDLRIGYAVVPDALAEPFKRTKFLIEPYPSGIVEQRALARFMSSGGYARHLRRMQRICGRRLLYFRSRLEETAGDRFELYPTDAGLHLFARWLGGEESYAKLKRDAAEEGVRWTDGAGYWLDGKGPVSALFGFAHLKEHELQTAIERLGTCLISK
jgi:GntR family transcriptional regulator/MocR family aminotransferase